LKNVKKTHYMKPICKWCGNNLNENSLQMNNEVYCSEACFKEEKFSLSILGTLFQSSLVPIIVGLIAFWLFLPIMVLYGYYKLDSIEYKIITPYIIISTLLLPISILSHNFNFVKNFTLPFRLIQKLSSARALPFLIVFFNYIYVVVYGLRIFVFNDIIGGKVQNTDILGFDFNITTADSLTVLSFLSIIIVLKKRNDSEINSNGKIN
jgi:hypothetical protein